MVKNKTKIFNQLTGLEKYIKGTSWLHFSEVTTVIRKIKRIKKLL